MIGMRRALERQLDLMCIGAFAIAVVVVAVLMHVTSGLERLSLGVVAVGTVMFMAGVGVFRYRLMLRLQRILAAIEASGRIGRPVKLPTAGDDELAAVTAGVNRLMLQVDEQQRRLREHIMELRRANEEVDRMVTLKDDFMAAANHQLRTPLTALVQGLELLQEDDAGARSGSHRDLLPMLRGQAARLVRLIEDLLDLSLLKSGRQALDRKPVDLAAALQQAQATWQEDGHPRRLRVSCDALPPVYMDARVVGDVIRQLVRYAARQTPAGGEVTLAGRLVGAHAEVTVTDEGPGVTPAQAARMFEPFVDVEHPDAPGTHGGGLGLAFCRQAVERHAGRIAAAAAAGRGTTIRFSLPCATPEFLLADACQQAQEEAGEELGGFGICLVAPAQPEVTSERGAVVLRRAAGKLRQHTHRGDRFVSLADHEVAIVAVADARGFTQMMERLRRLVASEGIPVTLRAAHCPEDGSPEGLLAVARGRGMDAAGSKHSPQSLVDGP